jgi:hypothetical protein
MRIGEARNEKDLVAALEQARDRRIDLRRGYETVWWNNIALVIGDHYAQWNPTVGRFEDRDLTWMEDWDEKKPRMVINHALTCARTELAKLTKSQPVMDVIANSDESVDIAAAKVGEAALDYTTWKFKVPKKHRAAFWWMIQTGLGAVYVGYDHLDDQAGYLEVLIDPATGEPTFDPARQREIKKEMEDGRLDEAQMVRYPLGDLELKVFSPFQLLPDETATDFEEITDLITDEIADIDVLKGVYGSKASDVRPESNMQLGVMETRMLARAGVPGGVGANSNTVENGARVSTYWLLPSIYRGNKFLENGLMIRWTAGRKVLEFSKVFPFQDGRMPFAFFQHIPSSTSIWPDCVINHIRGPNLEIDKTVSQLIENKDYMANPMWLIATQHKIKGEVKNVAGAIVRYRHVPNIPPPQPVPGMQMPQQVENLLAGLREQILEISGQSEVSRGNVPQGARSGVAVAYMQEEDDTKIAPTIANLEGAMAYMGSLCLERYSQFYTFERILRFYRRDGVFDVRKFKGADLKNNTDVVCQAGSAMPKSKAARQQFELELISLGLERDPKKIEETLELGRGEPDDNDKAISQANRENNMMMFGTWTGQSHPGQEGSFQKVPTAIPVKKWHNHQIHIQRHTSIMMDEEFDDLSISSPEIVRLFDEHIAMHQQVLNEQAQAQAQMLQAQKGAPDGPPTAASQPGMDANGVGPGTMQPGVLATTAQPDPIGGGSLQLRTRNRVGTRPAPPR